MVSGAGVLFAIVICLLVLFVLSRIFVVFGARTFAIMFLVVIIAAFLLFAFISGTMTMGAAI